MAELQDICDAIWTYGTRTLNTGVFDAPDTFLEEICKDSWENSVRLLTGGAPTTTLRAHHGLML